MPPGRRVFHLLILENDRNYGHRLGLALSTRSPIPFSCNVASNTSEALLLLNRKENFDALIFGDFKSSSSELESRLRGIPELRRAKPGLQRLKENEYAPGITVEDLARRIFRLISENSQGGISRRPLILLYAFSETRATFWLSSFAARQSRAGRELYYLPFMPAYRTSLPLHFGDGPELSSLLLRMAAGERLKPDELGPCFESQFDFFYALRPGGRAEDLYLSPLSLQRQLLDLFRQFIKAQDHSALALADLRFLSVAGVRALLPLADVFICDVPSGKSFSDRSGRNELGRLLSCVPDGVQFVEMQPDDWDFIRKAPGPIPYRSGAGACATASASL